MSLTRRTVLAVAYRRRTLEEQQAPKKLPIPMAIKAQRSSDAAPPRPYWADREARNPRDDRRRAPPINVDDPRRRYHAARDARPNQNAPSPAGSTRTSSRTVVCV